MSLESDKPDKPYDNEGYTALLSPAELSDGGGASRDIEVSPEEAEIARSPKSAAFAGEDGLCHGTRLLRRSNGQELHDPYAEDASKNSCIAPLWRAWPLIFAEESGILTYWDLWVLVMLLGCAVLDPYEAAFVYSGEENEEERNFFTMYHEVSTACFAVDLVLQFFVCHAVLSHAVLSRPKLVKETIICYLMGWFWVDALSVLPLDIIFRKLAKHTSSQALLSMDLLAQAAFWRVLRLFRLMRLVKFARIYERWHTSLGISFALTSLLKFLVLIFASSHWIACLWGFAGFHSRERPNWLQMLEQAKGGEEWWYRDARIVYVLSLYWAVVTLTGVGYGDITPTNPTEYSIATVCILVQAMIWAYVIGAVCGIIATMQPHEVTFKQKIDDLNDLMRLANMTPEMRSRLRSYLYESREMVKKKIQRDVIETLSPMMQGEVSLFMYEKYLTKVALFANLSAKLVTFAAKHIMVMVYPPREEIAHDRTLFILRRGIATRGGLVMSSGHGKGMWGEDMILTNPNLRDKIPVLAITYVEVLMLNYADLQRIDEWHPECVEEIRWEKFKMAMKKGVKLINFVVKMLGDEHFKQMDQRSRNCLSEDVLNGRLSRESLIGMGDRELEWLRLKYKDKASHDDTEDVFEKLEQRALLLRNGSTSSTIPVDRMQDERPEPQPRDAAPPHPRLFKGLTGMSSGIGFTGDTFGGNRFGGRANSSLDSDGLLQEVNQLNSSVKQVLKHQSLMMVEITKLSSKVSDLDSDF